MADLTVTAANVKPKSTAVLRTVTYGETITQGQPVYLSANKYYKADANLSSAAAAAVGIAITPGAADDFGIIATSGDIDVGATLTAGRVYIASATAGAIAPVSDSTTGWYTTILGIATNASNLKLGINASGVAL